MRTRTNPTKWVLVTFVLLVTLSMVVAADASAEIRRYVAPDPMGVGDGSSESDAAGFRSEAFWRTVNQEVQTSPVTVHFLAGVYFCDPVVRLADIGSPEHQLTLQGAPNEGTIFRKGPADTSERPDLFTLIGCTNVVVRDFHFRGDEPIGYALRIRNRSRHITVENCTWIDMHGIYYGATGAVGPETEHVTFRNCRFERIGSGAHSHMIYFAYEPRYLRVEDSHFEDCAGDFVRFRAGSDYGEVRDCTFISSGDYLNAAWPFISVPLFNNDDPQQPQTEEAPHYYEYFGTHFNIVGNRFIFPEKEGTEGRRFVFQFYHKGFSPPGREHLLDKGEAEILRNGSEEARRRLLYEKMGIDLSQVRLAGNDYSGEQYRAAFGSFTGYGSVTRGWEGYVDISDLLPDDAKQQTRQQR